MTIAWLITFGSRSRLDPAIYRDVIGTEYAHDQPMAEMAVIDEKLVHQKPES